MAPSFTLIAAVLAGTTLAAPVDVRSSPVPTVQLHAASTQGSFPSYPSVSNMSVDQPDRDIGKRNDCPMDKIHKQVKLDRSDFCDYYQFDWGRECSVKCWIAWKHIWGDEPPQGYGEHRPKNPDPERNILTIIPDPDAQWDQTSAQPRSVCPMDEPDSSIEMERFEDCDQMGGYGHECLARCRQVWLNRGDDATMLDVPKVAARSSTGVLLFNHTILSPEDTAKATGRTPAPVSADTTAATSLSSKSTAPTSSASTYLHDKRALRVRSASSSMPECPYELMNHMMSIDSTNICSMFEPFGQSCLDVCNTFWEQTAPMAGYDAGTGPMAALERRSEESAAHCKSWWSWKHFQVKHWCYGDESTKRDTTKAEKELKTAHKRRSEDGAEICRIWWDEEKGVRLLCDD